ncbi:RNA polymerase sigma-70 factor (ECF subfamily) [Streptomyces sp. 1114.5]|uniref:SigE family RNA polymerase sigma factor n=1 Tax=unclassified Streptomyces TaxID=2593676 RepID=UPI000BD158E7|nr:MULTISPECIES: SigE family RNA polymerase sigma factor [unclassified Streptomyces]RKT19919.1 RNA polymerase sigma-70 factor (ECF subfamily) [Streptomyces sp. 1114.5]SOB86117.1 RNA polymerase sigma-70 factor, ECF subfamily [Streptomyces sp. 1331.2]
MTPQEFDAFYAASFSRLTGQLYALTGNWSEAQDVVQEAFIRAWDRRRSFDPNSAPEAWIRTTARRLALSRWRRLARGLQLAAGYHHRQAPPTVEPPTEEHLMVVAALRELPDAQRSALVLHHMCDLSVEQVAAETGASVSAVKSRLARGRAALAAELADRAPTSEEGKLRV